VTLPNGAFPLELLIPLYNYPNYWDLPNYIWDDLAASAANTSVTAIVNPNSGPGGAGPNGDYLIGMAQLRTAGVKILGYVSTNYGNRAIADVKADIDLYQQLFNINGIFIDDIARSASMKHYYEELYTYAQTAWANSASVVLNFGLQPNTNYYSSKILAGATFVVYENDEDTWNGFTNGHPAATQSLAALVHGASGSNLNSIVTKAIAQGMDYLYVTDRTLEQNPWDGLPSFWSALVAALTPA